MTAMSRERLDHQRPTTMPPRGLARLVRATCLALLLSLFAVAATAQEASTPAATPSPEATPAPDMPRLELELEELNDSGVSGTVTLYDAGEQVFVVFDVEGVGGNHPAHIHAGVCGDLDPEPAFPLENVDENGESTTLVEVTLDELLDENHAIEMHLGPNQLGTLIACADVEGEPEVPEGTPAASPEASPEPTAEATPPSDGTGGTTEISDGTGGAEPTADLIESVTVADTDTDTDTETVDGQGDAPAAPTPAPTAPPAPTPTPEPEPTATAAPTQPATPSDTGTTDGTGGATTATTTTVSGDGTAGVSGKGEPVRTSTLPEQAGVGAALPWPQDAAEAAIWASAAGALVLGTAAVVIRRGERLPMTTPSRWSRLGL